MSIARSRANSLPQHTPPFGHPSVIEGISCGLRRGEFARAHRAGYSDVFGPIDRENIGAGRVVAVGADDIDAAAAGAEGLHKARIVERGALAGMEKHQD